MSEPGEITHLLQRADAGDVQAANDLYRLVQDDLRAIAARVLARKGVAGVDMCATMLVNDVFLKLVGQNKTEWNAGDRAKFFAYASKKMHELLIDAARTHKAKKRGGDVRHVDGVEEQAARSGIADLQALLDLKAALERFDKFAFEDALIFRLRHFLGCDFEEIGDVLSIKPKRAKDCFYNARLWLQSELKDLAVS